MRDVVVTTGKIYVFHNNQAICYDNMLYVVWQPWQPLFTLSVYATVSRTCNSVHKNIYLTTLYSPRNTKNNKGIPRNKYICSIMNI